MALFDATTLLAFLAAAVVLVLVPGPGTAWIIAQAVAGGTQQGLKAGLGLETATLIHALAAGLGLSALLATSALAFDVLKFAGAAYLVWLGIQAWRTRAPVDAAHQPPRDAIAGRSLYLRSVLAGLLNPKAALFFLAFLPQFVDAQRGAVWLQFLVLGALISIIGFSYSSLLSFAIGRLGKRITPRPAFARWRDRAIGTLFIGLGLRLLAQPQG